MRQEISDLSGGRLWRKAHHSKRAAVFDTREPCPIRRYFFLHDHCCNHDCLNDDGKDS